MEVDETVQQAEAIFRFTEEVERRLAEHGIAGVEDLLQLYTQFRHALSSVSLRELQWASAEAERLARHLQQVCGELEHLSALKVALEVPH
jgi:hypothetical protein